MLKKKSQESEILTMNRENPEKYCRRDDDNKQNYLKEL